MNIFLKFKKKIKFKRIYFLENVNEVKITKKKLTKTQKKRTYFFFRKIFDGSGEDFNYH